MSNINTSDKQEDDGSGDKHTDLENKTTTAELIKHEIMNNINSFKSEMPDVDAILPDRVKFKGIVEHDSCFNDNSGKALPPIPDGGWGWVVVFAAFLVSACADGLAFSFGILHEEFTIYFKSTQSETSVIGSLFIATPLLAGPVMSALVDRYGCRVMTMIAGVAGTFGFLMAAISNSVQVLCFTFGIITGLAMGVLYVTAVVSVAFWFDKRRNLAVSLASCGIGFGTLIYSPLINLAIPYYGWRSTVILLAGTLLNMCVCGALMRDPDWLKIKQKRDRSLAMISNNKTSRASSVSSRSSFSLDDDPAYLTADELKTILESEQSPEAILETLASTIAAANQLEATTQANQRAYKRVHSVIHLPTFIQHNEKVPAEVVERILKDEELQNIILRDYSDVTNKKAKESKQKPNKPAELIVEMKDKRPTSSTDQSAENSEEKVSNGKNASANGAKVSNLKPSEHSSKGKPTNEIPNTTHAIKWLRQVSTADHHYLKDVPLHSKTMMRRGAMLTIRRYHLRASSLPDLYKNSTWSLHSESDDELKFYDRFLVTLKNTFDFKMFTEFHFLMFNLSSLILSIWFIVPYFFLKSFMTARGMEGGDIMMGIIGVASSIGIVGLGWAGDQPWINVTKTYAGCLVICGLSVIFYPVFITSYWLLVVNSAVFGISFASSYSYTPAILMELMPIEKFTVAYGLILLSQGLGHLIGPPIGGLLYDVTGSWNLTFYLGGVFLIVSGVLVGVIPYTKDRRLCGSSVLLKEAEDEKNKEDQNDVELCF